MNEVCLEYNYTQPVKDEESWIIYLISFHFMAFETHVYFVTCTSCIIPFVLPEL